MPLLPLGIVDQKREGFHHVYENFEQISPRLLVLPVVPSV